MLKVTRIGLAAALVIGSFSVALAQDIEPQPLTPHQSREYRNSTPAPRFEHRNVGPNQPYNYYENTSPDQPWSSSTDPGNAGGGN